MPVWAKKLLFLAVLLAFWQAWCWTGLVPADVLPSPGRVGQALARGVADKGYLESFLVSARRMAVGYGASVFLGIALGTLLAWSRTLDDMAGSFLVALQSLPSVCWYPLALLWFGASEGAILFVLILGAVLSITIATSAGIRQVSPLYIAAAHTMGAHGLRLHLHVTLPAAFPSILGGMKLGWAFAWRALMAGELLYKIAGATGLGAHLQAGHQAKDMAQVLSVMVLIVALGMAVDFSLFGVLERRIRERWGLASRGA
jgi:NitT/TauT family transport system permease protein